MPNSIGFNAEMLKRKKMFQNPFTSFQITNCKIISGQFTCFLPTRFYKDVGGYFFAYLDGAFVNKDVICLIVGIDVFQF